MNHLRIAVCEYPVEQIPSLDAWQAKLQRLCREAAAEGATLLVFPEYASVELTALISNAAREDLPGSLRAMQPFREAFLAAHRELSVELGVTILAGSFPWECGGQFLNRAWLCTPDGQARFQDKIVMTRFEREEWFVSGSRELKLLPIPGVTLGVLICYDSEFPLLARQLCAGGADLILVPSCTDTEAGFHRVMLSCRARALEQQCFVVQAPLSGTAPWSPAIDINTGQAGVFSPVDRGFPPDGVIAAGAPAGTPWLIADLPLDALREVRRNGQVRNFADWPEQEQVTLVRCP